MKVTVTDNSTPPPHKEIKWNEQQLLVNINSRMVVLSSGEHSGDSFTGTVLDASCSGLTFGKSYDGLTKELYHLLPSRQSITLQND